MCGVAVMTKPRLHRICSIVFWLQGRDDSRITSMQKFDVRTLKQIVEREIDLETDSIGCQVPTHQEECLAFVSGNGTAQPPKHRLIASGNSQTCFTSLEKDNINNSPALNHRHKVESDLIPVESIGQEHLLMDAESEPWTKSNGVDQGQHQAPLAQRTHDGIRNSGGGGGKPRPCVPWR